jgi:catechol 2,3-dioxygenase-like lactoylglutathione lyase family enzyme
MRAVAEEAPPRSGWAQMVPELLVSDLGASLDFWRGRLGFRIAYSRDGFVYLERPEGAQIMLCQRDGTFETGPMTIPFGRGAMFQLYLEGVDAVAAGFAGRSPSLFMPMREVWRRTGDCESGQREFFVQDPDGYLVMVAERIGERPLALAT